MLRVDYVGLGSRIREQRNRLGITQAQLAEQMRLTQQYIGLLEHGMRQPTLETIITLCYVLDVPVEYLLQDSLPESLFTHYSSVGSSHTLRSVMGTLRNTLTNLLVPPERPHFIPPDAPATDEQLARIPFGHLDPPKKRRSRKKKGDVLSDALMWREDLPEFGPFYLSLNPDKSSSAASDDKANPPEGAAAASSHDGSPAHRPIEDAKPPKPHHSRKKKHTASATSADKVSPPEGAAATSSPDASNAHRPIEDAKPPKPRRSRKKMQTAVQMALTVAEPTPAQPPSVPAEAMPAPKGAQGSANV